VLATGNTPPGVAWAPAALCGAAEFVPDPWAPGALERIADDADVLLVGTGLTMVDAALALARDGRVVHAVSRHGLLPRAHVSRPLPVPPAPQLRADAGLAGLRRDVLLHLARSRRLHGDWRAGLDSLRPVTAALWQRLDTADQARFLADDLWWWNAHRHRVPPDSAGTLRRLVADERVTVSRGQVASVTREGHVLCVGLTDGRVLRVGAVVNCTGPAVLDDGTGDPLLAALVREGIAVTGPHRIGVATDVHGRLTAPEPARPAPLWTLGAPRRGALLESTAVPEIRGQADAVACAVLDALSRRSKPRPRVREDLYGLPLTTTPGAADLYNRGLERILLGSTNAMEQLAEAVRADPGFALGHAAVALLGHECGTDADVPGALRAAQTAVRERGEERERSLVAAVTARITRDATAGTQAVLGHIRAYPRDALAVGVAVPTISFNGLTSAERTWQLVEELRPHYGDDWWFAGQAAFVRQEQRRWQEAEELATRALAVQPAAGEAVHALTHVRYETGDHDRGRAWMDAWLRRHGEQSAYRAHFSWHAALHELHLDDRAAVLRRYRGQLAPPAVTGTRAVVDSASLLWRCMMTGHWDGDLTLAPVLAEAPQHWLRRPPTPFAALHGALALAAAGRSACLHRLRQYARDHADPVFREVVVPWCDALQAVTLGRWREAVRHLRTVLPRAGRLGGSAAQQEVVEDTLIHALTRSGQGGAAARLLRARLDRRPSPLDRARMARAQGPVVELPSALRADDGSSTSQDLAGRPAAPVTVPTA
ncbi:lycopene cyclase, partial [Streptomyces flaveolus]|uniref:lycopene cyclase n=1 Tax=Streptomyces flaveolus TaxID=67297 RepID=UPI003424CC4B